MTIKSIDFNVFNIFFNICMCVCVCLLCPVKKTLRLPKEIYTKKGNIYGVLLCIYD